MQGDGGAFDAGGSGECTADSQCTAGVNGRCEPPSGHGGIAFPPGVGFCSYDECSASAPCASGHICSCGASDGSGGRSANTCLPSNCNSDADCGADGYCSPTFDTTCGAFDGVVGYYCHKAADECTVDECTNDSDCKGALDGGGFEGPGYCAWDTSRSRWTCSYSVCAG